MDASVKSKKLIDKNLNDYSKENIAILWPEWKDTELNNEKWSLPKNGIDGLFLDTELTPMPPSLEPYEWIRPRYLKDLKEPLTVFTMTGEYPDLIKRNKHLLHSEFVRCFISSIINLQYCGKNGLEISGESDHFIWNGREEKWQGWMHVYSNNKAGRNVHHRPIINPNGKYIVRLHFLGCWRRIVVDDFIPVDKDGNPVLPTTDNHAELWPILLAKALLKIASLTWSQRREIVDFNPISCLTGWICLSLDVVRLPPLDKWEFLVKYAEHFELKKEGTNLENVKLDDEVEKKSSIKGKRIRRGIEGLQLPDKPRPITLFLDLKDMKEVTPETVAGLSPCWSHLVHVVQSRDLPLNPKDIKEPLARWKKYRWINWAIDRGLLDPAEYFIPIRCLKIVSPLRQCNNNRYLFNNDFLRDTKHQKITSLNNNVKEDTIDDISFWCDFNKMASYVKTIQLYYKPEYFEFTLKMSDFYLLDDQKKMNLASREQKKKGSKKSSTTEVVHGDSIEFMNTYVWPRSMKSSRNEPLYLFCDSLEDKFFLINLSIMEKRLPFSSQVSNEEDVVDDSIIIRLSSEDVSYLIVEKHSWFYRPTELRTLISISTSGSKSRVLELESGRHLLRIYCRSESHCFVSISSNTIFHVGDRFKIHRLMITESDRIDFLVKQISNSISTAFSSFGNINYVKNLMAFYRSYMPDLTNLTERRDRAFYKQIHDYFIEELLESIKMIFQSEDIPEMLSSLRIFFLDPMIGYERHKIPSIILNAFREINDDNDDDNDNDNESIIFKENYYSSESIDGEMATRIDYNQAATVIQSFFKMVIVKRYKQRHNINHKDHSKILTGLLKIAKLFDYSNGESLASSLIRKVIEKNQRFNEAYPCSEDFQYVLKIQECKGHLLNVKPNQWIPITRLIVNAKENETIFGTIQLFTNLSCHNLRLFENETGREMWRIVNNVAPSNYHYTTCGYTLFAYGWCDNPKLRDVEWIIHFVTIKGKSMFYQLTDKEPISLNTKIPNLIIEETFNTYIPNSMNLISKWIVNIVKDSVLSLRLMTSYELVQMKIRIVDDKENVLLEIEGRSILCIPVVYLKLEDSQTVYYIEAFVLDNSWPLTDAEWSVVLEKKTKRENLPVRNKSSISSSIRLIKRSETTRTRRSSKHQNDQHLDPPFWTLQAVIDADSGVEIIQDKRREEEIASLKESWSKDDPERPKRCKQLRETFLNAHALPPSTTSLNNLNNKISVKTNERMEKHKVRNSSKICRSSSSTENFAIRSLKEPKYRSFHLPKLDLSKYEKIEENGKERRTRTKSEEELLNDRLYADILEFNHSHDHFIQRLNDWSLKQITKYKQLWNIYEENSTQRKAQLEEAYEMRQDYISNVKSIDTSIKVKGGKKSVKR